MVGGEFREAPGEQVLQGLVSIWKAELIPLKSYFGLTRMISRFPQDPYWLLCLGL